MPSKGNNIFLLEVNAYRVSLTGQKQADNTCPVCVCFRFPGLVDLEFCEGSFCNDSSRSPTARGVNVTMTRGKSCLFAIGTSKLCRTAREFRASVTVYRRVHGGSETRLVARTVMEFDETFTDIIRDPDQPLCKMREIKQVLSLYEYGCSRRVGTVDVLVRLTSHGDLLATAFFRNPGSSKYKYVGVNEYVPTNASAGKNCCEQELPNKCCEYRTCRRRKTSEKREADAAQREREKSAKEIVQVKCIMMLMRRTRELYNIVSNGDPKRKPSSRALKRAAPCAFDPKCPVVQCPFRISVPGAQGKETFTGAAAAAAAAATTPAVADAAAATTPAVADATTPAVAPAATRVRTAKKTEKIVIKKSKEMVPDKVIDKVIEPVSMLGCSDLFGFKVGLVDPCRNYGPVPKTYCHITTQYSYTDLPCESRPQSKEKVHKHKKSGKKSEKGTKKAKKKKK